MVLFSVQSKEAHMFCNYSIHYILQGKMIFYFDDGAKLIEAKEGI